MQVLGFVRPSGAGHFLKGWIHPDLKLGFEIVVAVPMDGNVDAAPYPAGPADRRNRAFPGDFGRVPDADRMGQFASGTAPYRLEQARILLALHPNGGSRLS